MYINIIMTTDLYNQVQKKYIYIYDYIWNTMFVAYSWILRVELRWHLWLSLLAAANRTCRPDSLRSFLVLLWQSQGITDHSLNVMFLLLLALQMTQLCSNHSESIWWLWCSCPHAWKTWYHRSQQHYHLRRRNCNLCNYDNMAMS